MSAPPGAAPTYSQCVIGYRAWDADERDRLWPLSARRRPWEPGLNTARCACGGASAKRLEFSRFDGRWALEALSDHTAPAPDCECGLYSWRKPKRAWDEQARFPRVVGAVASWGNLQVHGAGFRAEHACVVTLAFRPHAELEELGRLSRIAGRYGAELVALADLEQAAARHGAPLPDSVGPPPEAPVEHSIPWWPPRPAPNLTPEQVGTPPRPRGFHGDRLRDPGGGLFSAT